MGMPPIDTASDQVKTVSFSYVEVREYPMILGDNPAVKKGLPVQIDWCYTPVEKQQVDLYEYFRKQKPRKSRRARRISWEARHEYLTKQGNDPSEFLKVMMEIQDLKQSRVESAGVKDIETFNNLLHASARTLLSGKAIAFGAALEAKRMIGDRGSMVVGTAARASVALGNAAVNAGKATTHVAVNATKATASATFDVAKMTSSAALSAGKKTTDAAFNATKITANAALSAGKITTTAVGASGKAIASVSAHSAKTLVKVVTSPVDAFIHWKRSNSAHSDEEDNSRELNTISHLSLRDVGHHGHHHGHTRRNRRASMSPKRCQSLSPVNSPISHKHRVKSIQDLTAIQATPPMTPAAMYS